MAEAFARAYGEDVLVPSSAGFSPPDSIPVDTLLAMKEKNLDLTAQFPKSLTNRSRSEFDLIINMSGIPLPTKKGAPVREWTVQDPIGLDYQTHCAVRDHVETLVKDLIQELRAGQNEKNGEKS